MDMTRGRLAELALGKERANRVDSAIPQPVFNGMSQAQRDDVAGWYYEPEKANVFGRLLTQTECWTAIRRHLLEGRLMATVGAATDLDLGWAIAEWPCLPYHVERREVNYLHAGRMERTRGRTRRVQRAYGSRQLTRSARKTP
jgi:hypothetical protein